MYQTSAVFQQAFLVKDAANQVLLSFTMLHFIAQIFRIYSYKKFCCGLDESTLSSPFTIFALMWGYVGCVLAGMEKCNSATSSGTSSRNPSRLMILVLQDLVLPAMKSLLYLLHQAVPRQRNVATNVWKLNLLQIAAVIAELRCCRPTYHVCQVGAKSASKRMWRRTRGCLSKTWPNSKCPERGVRGGEKGATTLCAM